MIPRYRYRYRPIPHGIGIGRYCVVSVADTDTPKNPDFWLSDCFRAEVVVKKFVEKYLNDRDFRRFQVRIESIFKYVVKTLCWRHNDRLLRAIFKLVSVSVPVSVSADTKIGVSVNHYDRFDIWGYLRPLMAFSDLKRPQMTSNDLKWPQMTSNDLKWSWPPMISNDLQ